jgi:hypothetical protein
MTQRMKEEPILQMETDKLILIHVYDKPFMVRFPNRREMERRVSTQQERDCLSRSLVRHTFCRHSPGSCSLS